MPVCAVFASVMLSLAVTADTVVWYTFDDLGNVGAKLNGISTVQNAASRGTYDATVYQMAGATKNEEITSAIDYIYVTNGIPASFRVFDPAARVMAFSVDRAVRFASNGGGQAGAMLETATDMSFFTDSFTVEALIHFPNGMANANYGVLATQLRDNSTYAWKIHVNWNNQTTFYFLNSKGQEVNTGPITLSDSGKFNDGKWHHVAMIAEQSNTSTIVKIFYDYALRKTFSFDSRIQFPSTSENSKLQIGGTTLAGQLFMGEIGEFRYSDSALSVAKFLRPRSMSNRLDNDCVLYYDFEEMTDDWSWFAAPFGRVVNKAMPGIMDGSFAPGEISGKGTLPKIDTEVPSDVMYLSGTNKRLMENGKSFYNNYQNENDRRTARHLSCNVASGISLSNTDFTIEMFYKTDGDVLYWTPIFRRNTEPAQQLYIGVGDNVLNNDGHSYLRAIVQSVSQDNSVTNSVNMRDTAQSNDGEWHHLALVRNGRSLTFYRDGGVAGTGMLDYDSLLGESDNWLFAGGGGGVNTFNGWIDSVRVTLRALSPEEFLQKATRPGFFIRVR